MNTTRRSEVLEKSLERLLTWIAAVDVKIATFFAIDTAMLAVLAALLPPPKDWELLAGLTAAVSGALLLGSLGLLAAAAFPRTTGPRQSLTYFGGIASREYDQYWTEVSNSSEDDYAQDLARQCHRNAEIARLKHALVRLAAAALFLAVLPWVLAIFSLYSMPHAESIR